MMKKKFKLFFVIMTFLIFSLNYNIFGSTTTYDREEADNYGVPSSIIVGTSNKEDVLETPLVNAEEKVYDFAELLTDSEEKALYTLIESYIEKYDMDMVIVTIDENNKKSQVEYADDFYDYNEFGIGDTRDGILFLIDMDNRQMHISTTGEAIRMYNDSRIEDILDDTYYYISDEDYYNCAKAFITSSSSFAAKGIPSGNKNSYIGEDGDIVYTTPGKAEMIMNVMIGSSIYILIGAAIATTLFFVIASAKHKVVKKAVFAKEYLVKDSFKLTKREDDFLGSHTTSRYNPPSSSSSSSSSHSSTHSSSSGSHHGGGSRGF